MKININIENCAINKVEIYENNSFQDDGVETAGVKLMLQEGLYLKSSMEGEKNVITTVETEEEGSLWILNYDDSNSKTSIKDASTGMYWTFVPEEQGKEIQLLPKSEDCNNIQQFNSIYSNVYRGFFSLLDETKRYVSYSKLPPTPGEVLYGQMEIIFIILMKAIEQ